jgi:hypothetical protein
LRWRLKQTVPAGLRSLSVMFAPLAVVRVFMLGREMFDDDTAAVAAWCGRSRPLRSRFRGVRRMCSMLVALSLAHLNWICRRPAGRRARLVAIWPCLLPA